MVRIYNTLTRSKEELRPGNPDGKIRLYECGLTVYDEPHIGNARINIVFDTWRRWLEYRGFPVVHVRNITDVEDKIIRRAQEKGVSTEELVAQNDAVRKDLYRRLNLLPPAHEPYASQHIGEIVELIRKLFSAGLAYAAGGDVYFSVRKFNGYGKLSGRSLEELRPGARIEPGEHKADPLDFTLWKAAKPGEPKWESPWGPGRPGWHIECSAMSMKYLGETLDIHGGGSDLIFPHHEDEIAQSEGATGKCFSRIWVHVGSLTLDGKKMAKSEGNVLRLGEVLDRLPAPALRLLLAQTHYRSPLDWSDSGQRQARETYDSLRRQLDLDEPAGEEAGSGALAGLPDPSLREEVQRRLAACDSALDDDLGTPRALAELFVLSRSFAAVRERLAGRLSPDLSGIRGGILSRFAVLGIELDARQAELPQDLRALLGERAEARARKDWARSDSIRTTFIERGWSIEDTPRGQVVRRA
jgi:cysteinyl-tRNA synthetase